MAAIRRLTPPRPRLAAGLALTIGGAALAVALLIPFRSRIDVDTAALVLVVPVVLGTAVGGLPVAPVGVVTGFFAYDFFFIPPYYTFRVGAGEHWVGLGVYAVVALVMAAFVAQVQRARTEAEGREAEARILVELTSATLDEDGLDDALRRLVHLACELIPLEGGAVVLADDQGRLHSAAGERIPALDFTLEHLSGHRPRGPLEEVAGRPGLLGTPLPITYGPGGILLTAGSVATPRRRRLVSFVATQVAVCVERSRLQAEATRRRSLEEVDQLRNAVIGAVSHDLRTPLASIKASVSDLADPAVALSEDDRRMLVRTIEEETDRLTRFVTDLLDMSRIESGALEVRRSATSIEELVDATVARLGVGLAGHRLSVDVADLPLVDVDEMLISHVLANLLENAMRHTPAGSAIHLGAAPLGHWVEVRVSDNGSGIPAAERDRVFEPFFRLRTGNRAPGTGMGLAICRGIVEAHGGQIWVEATPGGGASFAFRLPILVNRAPMAEPEPSPSPRPERARGS
jgi:two-component system sensor histidine kinase KdpD